MKTLGLLFAVICLSLLKCYGQNDPLSLTKKIFAREKFAELDTHVTGEYDGRPNGTDFPKNVSTNFELLDQNEKTAVVAMTIVDSAGNSFDTYLHFVNEKVWKVTAFRALAVTGIYSELISMYEKMSPTQRDSLDLLEEKLAELQGSEFKPESMERTVKNAKLVLSSDKDLIDYFKMNVEKFEYLKDGLIAKGILHSGKKFEEIDASKTFQHLIDDLLLDYVGLADLGSPENLEFIIGGMIDNTVGYIYVKDKKNKPVMTPSHYIMVREIGNGWYLFKTT